MHLCHSWVLTSDSIARSIPLQSWPKQKKGKREREKARKSDDPFIRFNHSTPIIRIRWQLWKGPTHTTHILVGTARTNFMGPPFSPFELSFLTPLGRRRRPFQCKLQKEPSPAQNRKRKRKSWSLCYSVSTVLAQPMEYELIIHVNYLFIAGGASMLFYQQGKRRGVGHFVIGIRYIYSWLEHELNI